MKSKLIKKGAVTIGALIILFVSIRESLSVPVMPNEAMVEGIVSEYSIVSSGLVGMQPEQVLYRLTVHIESSGSIDDRPNYFFDKNGQDIKFYSKEKLYPELFGRRIRAKVRLTGDERGRVCWILSIKTIE